jgi:glycosyltransferase involved in cell wall biosynthesis
MMTRLRLLLLLPFAPRRDAAHGGGRVIAEFLTRMTARHQVAVLYIRSSDEPGADDFFRERCELIEEIIKPVRKNTFPQRILRYLTVAISLLQLQPLWVTDWSSKVFARQARLIAQKFQPHVIQAEYHVMGQYLADLHESRAPRVLVQYEPGASAALYIKDLPPIVSEIIHRIEKLSWRRYEARLYREVEAIVVFTEADRRVVQIAAGQTPIHIIPPGTVISERPLNPLGNSSLSMLFVGNFFHPPNVDAAQRLIHSIFPSVQKCIPGVKLFIVGDNPPAEIKKMSSESVIITGRVPEIMPYLNQAALFVAPLYQGGGIRIKVLEALAAGKAIVTTPLAAQGLNLVDGEQISIAESDPEFSECIIHLLKHPEERTSLATGARAWACANLGWDRTIEAHEALWQTLLSSG